MESEPVLRLLGWILCKEAFRSILRNEQKIGKQGPTIVRGDILSSSPAISRQNQTIRVLQTRSSSLEHAHNVVTHFFAYALIILIYQLLWDNQRKVQLRQVFILNKF